MVAGWAGTAGLAVWGTLEEERGGRGGTWLKPEPPPLPPVRPTTACYAASLSGAQPPQLYVWDPHGQIHKLRGELPVKYTDVYVLPIGFQGTKLHL